MNFYYRLCSTIHYFFDKKMKITDPSIFSIFFISMMEAIYILGVYYFVCILLVKHLATFKYFMFAILTFFLLLNYCLIYRKAKQYNYYSQRINSLFVIILIILGYLVMAIGGQMYRVFFFHK